MSRNIPSITIGQVMNFNAAGMPDNVQYEIAAIIDTPDEISPLGRIRFEDASDLVTLYNILGNYIHLNGFEESCQIDEALQKGGTE